jgi:dihydrofolate reductase
MHGALLRPTEAPERPVLWVVSRSSTSVGPNATLVNPGVEGAIGRLKAERDGEWEVARPSLAGSLTDEYRISLHPVVLGHGKLFFVGSVPSLRLVANNQLDENVIRLTYVPA